MQRKTEEFSFTGSRTAKTLMKDLILWLSLSRYIDNLVSVSPHRFLTAIYRLAFICRACDCQQPNQAHKTILSNHSTWRIKNWQFSTKKKGCCTQFPWEQGYVPQVWYCQSSQTDILGTQATECSQMVGRLAALQVWRQFWNQNYLYHGISELRIIWKPSWLQADRRRHQ